MPGSTARRSPPSIPIIDFFGHSITAAGGTTIGDHNAYPDKLAKMLGAAKRRNASIGGASAAWPTAAASGDGGWSLMRNKFQVASGNTAPYIPASSIVSPYYGLNDLARVGSTRLNCFIEAMRNILSYSCAARTFSAGDAAFTYGAAMNTIALFTNWVYLYGGAKYTNAAPNEATEYVQLAVPADYRAGQVVALSFPVIPGPVAPAATMTLHLTVDGVDRGDVVVNIAGGGVADAENGKSNAIVLRFGRADCGMGLTNGVPAFADGAHTIRVAKKAESTAGVYFINDGAWIEADPADGPILLVPNTFRPAAYTIWNGFPHGPGAGTDPINDAGIATLNTALAALMPEFPSRTLFVDVDSALAKDARYWEGSAYDGAHPNNLGHSVIAETLFNALMNSGLLTPRRVGRLTELLPDNWTINAELGKASILNNGWINYASSGGTDPPISWYKGLDGRVYLKGAVKSGSSVGATIVQFGVGYKPKEPLTFKGINSTGGEQTWQIDTSGNVSVISGGDLTKSKIQGEFSFQPTA